MKTIFERAARALEDEKLFAYPQSVKDDHIHFHRAGVPVVDLIDFRFGPGNRWWHTLEDKPENCSAESLGRVGRLVLAAMPELEQVFGGPEED
jgi:Zn-dependent M28 family amino/carboxypeptidase